MLTYWYSLKIFQEYSYPDLSGQTYDTMTEKNNPRIKTSLPSQFYSPPHIYLNYLSNTGLYGTETRLPMA